MDKFISRVCTVNQSAWVIARNAGERPNETHETSKRNKIKREGRSSQSNENKEQAARPHGDERTK